MRAVTTLAFFTLVAALLVPQAAQAKPLYCDFACSWSTCGSNSCTHSETEAIITCSDWGVYDTSDPDCDGLDNPYDNCDYVPNSDQANCDGDELGDVCDSVDGIYQYVPYTAQICYVNGYNFYDGQDWNNSQAYVYYKGLYEDVSACNQPDEWRNDPSGPFIHWCYDEGDVVQCCIDWHGYSGCQQYYLYDNCP